MMKVVALLVLFVACAEPSVPRPRFANAEPVRRVDDRRDVARPPAERPFVNLLHQFDGSFVQPVVRALALEASQRARGVNALDEVPDSTWFTNRIGVRELTPEEIHRGPLTIDGPEAYTPWTVTKAKHGGDALGLFVRDSRGELYLIKLDRKGFPEIESAAHVIVNRILWACGYNVTEDVVAYVRPHDIVVDDESTKTDTLRTKTPFRREDLDAMLARAATEPDGRIRVMASRLAPGRAIGGHPSEGVRRDDPNDRIPHELRRDLRGTRPIFAWLDHVDAKESNTLDVWIADEHDPTLHYVRHYHIDYGKSLGAMAMIARDERRSYEYRFDPSEMASSLVSLGFEEREWDERVSAPLRGVGLFDRDFDPGQWKPFTPVYRPLMAADRYDWLWGAKLLMRFTPAQLRAAVEAGRLSDPRAVDYLVDTLVARQRAVAHYAFSRVRPLDRFTVAGDTVCAVDLALVYGLETAIVPAYAVTTFDRRGRRLGRAVRASIIDGSRVCGRELPMARSPDGYTIVRFTPYGSPGPHGSEAAGATFVHVARDPLTRQRRVIGLWRQ